MKTRYTTTALLLFLLCTQLVSGQIVTLPDANFKAKLVSLFDFNSDGEIQVEEASSTTYLDVSASNIIDMTGIEAFENLTTLICMDNQITSLDVSNLTQLTQLYCQFNQLTSLNITGLSNLEVLFCQNNLLSSLDLTNLSSLTELECQRNQINSLNITGANALEKINCGLNQLTSLDVTTLSNLIKLDCISNQLTSINVANNINLVELDLSFNQIAVLNVQNLTNLQKLTASNNQLTTLDVSILNTLQTLKVSNNYLTALDVSGLSNLRELEFSYNSITSISLTALTQLERLISSNNPLTTIDVSGLTALKLLECENNQIASLNVNGLVNLEHLNCRGNDISSLNIGFLTNLKLLSCGFNELTSLDVTPFVNLTGLDCSSNQITALDLSNNNNLQFLNCSINQLTALDVTNLTQLRSLICGNNAIPNVDFSGLTQLYELFVDSTGRTSLDVSNQPLLRTLYCNSNPIPVVDVSNSLQLYDLFCGGPNLTQVFLKNGVTENYFGLTLSPNLQFVCGDEGDLNEIQTAIASSGSMAVATSYCSFVPGGNYNTIAGSSRFDSTNNGCDTNDTSTINLKININDGATNETSLVNMTGNYAFYTGAGNFTVTPQLENPSYFTVSPNTTIVNFPAVSNATEVRDFCLTANGNHPDVEIVIAPDGVARPGFEANYHLVYKNKGNQTLSGTIQLSFNDALTDFISAQPSPTTNTFNTLTWSYTNLQPFQSKVIELVLEVNTPTEIPAVNSGDILNFNATISATPSDEFPQDNSFTYNQVVVNSFDPNDITCLQGESLATAEIGNYLHYLLRFENTGDFAAENVVTKMEIDATKYDISSLQVLNTSHNALTKIVGNKVEFIFEGIQLAAAAGNPPVGGHGNVLFKIRSQDNLNNGETVSKRANIYFDYNFPITTNDAVTIYQNLNNSIIEHDNSVTIYPNPVVATLGIKSQNPIISLHLYDAQGRVLESVLEQNTETTLDISTRATGIYFLKIVTEKGSKIEKIIKE